ncbi:MAG: DUF4276 family protein [Acidobacteria bacterium]|nr:DUF4276 family protein [Acidobacteriota bacterium]
MRFVLFVEGDTERALPAFLKRWLDPKLPQRVGITPVRFTGWAELKREVKKRAHLYLNGPQAGEIIAVISLLDLYGPDFYPAHVTGAGERYDWAKNEIEREVGHPKFRHFFAVHETEAWLLSQPEMFPAEVRGGFPGRINQPEMVNFTEPPSHLLGRLYRDKLRRTYKKIVNGRELFEQLDPDVARDKYPRLRELLDEMLLLAQEALQ